MGLLRSPLWRWCFLVFAFHVFTVVYCTVMEDDEDTVVIEAAVPTKSTERNKRQIFVRSPAIAYHHFGIPSSSLLSSSSDWNTNPLSTSPCFTSKGVLGRCMSFRQCYPYFKLPELNNWDSWILGMYDTCSYFTVQGRQMFGVCCNANLMKPDETTSTSMPIIEDIITSTPTMATMQQSNVTDNTKSPYYPQYPVYPQYPNWPPPLPTHPPHHTIPPLPTHPPSPGFPFPSPAPTPAPTQKPKPPSPSWPPSAPTQPPVPAWPPALPTHPTTKPPSPAWPPAAPTHPTQKPTTSTTPKPIANPQPPATDGSCGAKNGYQDQERIVGGHNAEVGEWPWIAALFNGGRQFCGGSLIDSSHILSAAHCVAHMSSWDVARLTVRLGDHNIKTNSEIKHVEKKVKRVVRHRGFDSRTLYNDIAILTLDKPIEFTKQIRPICLPSGGGSDYAGHTATVIGWGSLRESGPQPAVLQEVSIPIWTNNDCRIKYGHAAPGGIVEHMLCAGQASRDSCSGDSGGPLMVNSGSWTQVGIVSWGIGCGKGQYPGVYTRVTNFLPWIHKNLK